MKYYRSAIVCLVLLCVLLLTAVIMLCLKFTQERDQQTIKIDNLNKVTHYLLTKYQNLTNERDRLIWEKSELQKNNTADYLLTKIQTLTNERDRLMWEKSELQKNLNKADYLQTKYQTLTNERDRLMWEKSELQKNLNTADGWIYYKSSLYFISSEQKSWSESRSYCRNKGADLIIINNKEEQDFVTKTCKEIIWIGLTDSDVEGTWQWVDGSILNTGFWVPGEPNSSGDEDCALSYPPGWNDVACYKALQFICEKNIFK